MNTSRTTERITRFYQDLLESSTDSKQKPYFVTFRTQNGNVIDIVVRAEGKKQARLKAEAITAGKELCGPMRYVGVN